MLHPSSRTGASANRRSGVSLLQLLINLVEGDPTASKENMFRKWRALVVDNPEDVDAALLYTFTNLWTTVDRDRQKVAPKMRKKPKATPAEMQAKVDEVREQIVKKVFSFDFVMPNGLPLGDCTFGYLAKMGSVFTRISTMGRANKTVRSVLTEKKLQEIALPA